MRRYQQDKKERGVGGWTERVAGGTVDQRLLYTDASLFPGRLWAASAESEVNVQGSRGGHNFN